MLLFVLLCTPEGLLAVHGAKCQVCCQAKAAASLWTHSYWLPVGVRMSFCRRQGYSTQKITKEGVAL